MGSLLTLSIQTDAISEMLNNSKKFCEAVYGSLNNLEASTIGVGNCCEVADVQAIRHKDNSTAYIHMGGTLSEMNAYSLDTEKIMAEHPEFFGEMLKYMKDSVGELEKKFAESKRDPRVDCGD